MRQSGSLVDVRTDHAAGGVVVSAVKKAEVRARFDSALARRFARACVHVYTRVLCGWQRTAMRSLCGCSKRTVALRGRRFASVRS
jgi:hypothetical protein